MRQPLLLAFVFAAACGSPSSRVDEILSLTGDVTAGETVYTAQCAICHLADGTGESGGGAGEDLTGLDEPEDEVVSIILDGEGAMTAFGDVLTDQEIADVTAYLYDAFGE